MHGIVDPRITQEIGTHLPDRCTIQSLTEAVDADGQVVEIWTDRHVDVPCNVMPVSSQGGGGREIKRKDLTYAVANFSIALQGDYPDIVESDRAVVAGVAYDVLLAERILGTMTRLSCEVVR